ncbi:hypothetical protein MPSEU_000427300 [Mayamaea pseudoterrestris]|nr:hypothetical protein MPSEU_000427300 [Mayamaea pseudoterrestris]
MTIEGTKGDSAVKERQQPLFDQLRSNKEEDEDREESQRAMMRGTLALDEDDAAYLMELQREKDRQEALKQKATDLELAAFHAAKMKQEESNNLLANEMKNEGAARVVYQPPLPTTNQATSKLVPTIIRRKRKIDESDEQKAVKFVAPSSAVTQQCELTPFGLGGLLSGYESDDSASSNV